MISGSLDNVAKDAEETPAPGQLPMQQNQEPVITPRTSMAIPIWLAVVIGVLTALFIQTSSQVPSYNFFIEGNPDIVGAQVAVDGAPVGTLQTSDDGGVKTTGLRARVVDGHHNIEITKPGYKPFKAEFKMHGEDYISVQLQKE